MEEFDFVLVIAKGDALEESLRSALKEWRKSHNFPPVRSVRLTYLDWNFPDAAFMMTIGYNKTDPSVPGEAHSQEIPDDSRGIAAPSPGVRAWDDFHRMDNDA